MGATSATGRDVSLLPQVELALPGTSPGALPLAALLGAVLMIPWSGCKRSNHRNADPGFTGPKVVRKMKKAGTWYSANPTRLGAELDRYVMEADLPTVKGRLVGLISPHAGYRFSGPTAALGFKLLGSQRGINRVVLLGVSHHRRLVGISIRKVTHYQTPFGLLRVDIPAANRLRRLPEVGEEVEAHAQEHSLEMQMPFLKRVRPSVLIIPMLVGAMNGRTRRRLAARLGWLVRPGTVFLASSDFTHRGRGFGFEVPRGPGEPLQAALRRMDFATLPFIRGLDGNGLMAHCRRTQITMCGRSPTALMLEILRAARLSPKTTVLGYTTSGHVLGDWRSSVSYLSVALTVEK